jgi:GxxExxY protein
MSVHEPLPESLEQLATKVVHMAYSVHTEMGPGLIENIYEACMCHELSLAGIPFQRQLILPVTYKGIRIDAGLRLDVLVAGELILELKSVEKMIPLFDAQVLTYLKLTQKRLGLLINFNVPKIKDGIKRIIR